MNVCICKLSYVQSTSANRYGEKVNARDFDSNPNLVSEMDALVAYLQVIGTMVDFKAAENIEGNE